MKQLPFELLFELGEWWKVNLLTGERVLATDDEVEMWTALMEMANAPRDPVIIEQPTASTDGPTMTRNEVSRVMNGTAYIYDQFEMMGQILNIRAFPGIAKAMEQAALIYDMLGKRWGIKPAQRRQTKVGDPTFADVINAEMKKQQANPDPTPPDELNEEEIVAAELEQAQAQVAKGGDYASW